MDRAAIFHEIVQRNALRKANGLPLLDVRAEYAHQVALANEREYQELCGRHAAEREMIRQQVLDGLRAKHGSTFGQTMGGNWLIGTLTYKRFTAYMAEKHGIRKPSGPSVRNAVVYGGAHKTKP